MKVEQDAIIEKEEEKIIRDQQPDHGNIQNDYPNGSSNSPQSIAELRALLTNQVCSKPSLYMKMIRESAEFTPV